MKMVKIWSLKKKKKKKGRLKTFFVEGEEAHEDEEHLGATEEELDEDDEGYEDHEDEVNEDYAAGWRAKDKMNERKKQRGWSQQGNKSSDRVSPCILYVIFELYYMYGLPFESKGSFGVGAQAVALKPERVICLS